MPVGSQKSEREMTVPVTGAQPQPGVPEQGKGYTLDPLKRTVRTGVTFFIRYGRGRGNAFPCWCRHEMVCYAEWRNDSGMIPHRPVLMYVFL